MREFLEDSALEDPPYPPNEVAHCMLKLSEEVIVLTAANLVLLELKKSPISPLFGQENSASELKNLIIAHISRQTDQDATAEIDHKISKIRAFLSNETGEAEKKWNSLNYLVDGKLFLVRFSKWFGLLGSPRLHLARKIRDRKLIDPEIQNFILVVLPGMYLS